MSDLTDTILYGDSPGPQRTALDVTRELMLAGIRAAPPSERVDYALEWGSDARAQDRVIDEVERRYGERRYSTSWLEVVEPSGTGVRFQFRVELSGGAEITVSSEVGAEELLADAEECLAECPDEETVSEYAFLDPESLERFGVRAIPRKQGGFTLAPTSARQ